MSCYMRHSTQKKLLVWVPTAYTWGSDTGSPDWRVKYKILGKKKFTRFQSSPVLSSDSSPVTCPITESVRSGLAPSCAAAAAAAQAAPPGLKCQSHRAFTLFRYAFTRVKYFQVYTKLTVRPPDRSQPIARVFLNHCGLHCAQVLSLCECLSRALQCSNFLCLTD